MNKKILYLLTVFFLLSGCQKPQAEVRDIKVNNIEVHISNVFGETGKKVVNLVITPVNATITNITWEVDKDCVVINKLTNTSAEVYVTDYMADFATITVTEELSGKVATGRVYAYAKTQISYTTPAGGGSHSVEAFDYATNDKIAYWEYDDVINFGVPVKKVVPYNTPASGMTKFRIHYSGSYTPDVYHVLDYPDKTYVYVNTTKVAGYGSRYVEFGLQLAVGTVRLYITQTEIGGAPTSWYGSPSGGGAAGDIGNFIIERASQVQGMSMGDITFFD